MNETQTTQETKETVTIRPTLLVEMLYAIEKHIDQQVEAKLNNVMQSHATMKQIDEGFEARIQELIADAVGDHESEQEHHTRDDIAEQIGDQVNQEVAVQIRNHDFSNQLHDAITDYDFDDKIDSFDFDDKMDEWKDMNDILDSDQAREIVNEILDEALDERLKALLSKLSITIKGD
jgi:DNA gyrase/topoisomerase IV subunit B